VPLQRIVLVRTQLAPEQVPAVAAGKRLCVNPHQHPHQKNVMSVLWLPAAAAAAAVAAATAAALLLLLLLLLLLSRSA
jgi:hypothetical protein